MTLELTAKEAGVVHLLRSVKAAGHGTVRVDVTDGTETLVEAGTKTQGKDLTKLGGPATIRP